MPTVKATEMFRGGKVSRFSRMAIQSRNFYAGYSSRDLSTFKRADSALRNFSAGIRKCMSWAKLFHRGTFPVYGMLLNTYYAKSYGIIDAGLVVET